MFKNRFFKSKKCENVFYIDEKYKTFNAGIFLPSSVPASDASDVGGSSVVSDLGVTDAESDSSSVWKSEYVPRPLSRVSDKGSGFRNPLTRTQPFKEQSFHR